MRSGTFHHKMSSGMMKFRIGYGYDVHALGEGLPLILGGVEIEHAKGCIAHSDGDVVLHAISDALLGAAALGDIGLHFPDTSDEFKGADSKLLLARCVELLREKGYAVGNVDCTISMQRPKLRPHIDRMRETIARTIGIDTDAVSVKATTTERLGFEGREEGVSVAAVAPDLQGIDAAPDYPASDMDAFPGCFCKSVVGKMISTGSGPNHPTCVIPRYRSTAGGRVSASDRSEIIAAAQVGLRRLSLLPSEPPVRPHNTFAEFGPSMRIPTFQQALAME